MKFKIVTHTIYKQTYVIWNHPIKWSATRSRELYGIQISGLLSIDHFIDHVNTLKTYSTFEPFPEIKCSLSIKAVYKFMKINGVYEKI